MSATVSTTKFRINLSDGSTHEVEGDTLEKATAKLLKRKAIKDAGLTVVETPADTPDSDTAPETPAGPDLNLTAAERIAASRARDAGETPPTPKVSATQATAAIVAELVAELPAVIAAYFAEHVSTDPAAPMHGAPFKQNDRLYLQLEGRGGAGKGTDDYTPTGLRPYMLATKGDATPGKGAIRQALVTLGFERNPFSYNHPERAASSASYYSALATAISNVAPVEARKTAPRGGKKGTNVNPGHTVSDDPIIPQSPEGSDEDVALLEKYRAAYLAAQDALKSQHAEWGRNPIKKDASKAVKDAAKKERDETTERLTGLMSDAHEELLTHRKAMHAKNVEAEKAASKDDESTDETPAPSAA